MNHLVLCRQRLEVIRTEAARLAAVLHNAHRQGRDGSIPPEGAAQLLADLDAVAGRLRDVANRVSREISPTAVSVEE